VSTHLPHVTKPQAGVLALWSLGIVLAQRCGLTSVAVVLVALFDRREATVREQLRDWYRAAPHQRGTKRGDKRRTLDVITCFPALLRWCCALMPQTCHTLALAMGTSTLGQRFTILTISVLIRGCAIPVAWHVVAATRPGCNTYPQKDSPLGAGRGITKRPCGDHRIAPIVVNIDDRCKCPITAECCRFDPSNTAHLTGDHSIGV
jgi:hypothetical protein